MNSTLKTVHFSRVVLALPLNGNLTYIDLCSERKNLTLHYTYLTIKFH